MESLPLRDIHLPLAVGFWPLAPGWWLLIGGTLIFLIGGLFLFLRARRPTALKQALKTLDGYLRNSDLTSIIRNQEISRLLRQLAISTQGRDEIAGLSGPTWIEWIERKCGEQKLSTEIKHFLGQGPYSPQHEVRIDSSIFQEDIRAVFIAVGETPSLKGFGKWAKPLGRLKSPSTLLSRFSKRSIGTS